MIHRHGFILCLTGNGNYLFILPDHLNTMFCFMTHVLSVQASQSLTLDFHMTKPHFAPFFGTLYHVISRISIVYSARC